MTAGACTVESTVETKARIGGMSCIAPLPAIVAMRRVRRLVNLCVTPAAWKLNDWYLYGSTSDSISCHAARPKPCRSESPVRRRPMAASRVMPIAGEISTSPAGRGNVASVARVERVADGQRGAVGITDHVDRLRRAERRAQVAHRELRRGLEVLDLERQQSRRRRAVPRQAQADDTIAARRQCLANAAQAVRRVGESVQQQHAADAVRRAGAGRTCDSS